MVILDTTPEEQENDATKKGQENSTEETRIGQEGERRKSYSAAVIDGMKRNTTIYVGDSLVLFFLLFPLCRGEAGLLVTAKYGCFRD